MHDADLWPVAPARREPIHRARRQHRDRRRRRAGRDRPARPGRPGFLARAVVGVVVRRRPRNEHRPANPRGPGRRGVLRRARRGQRSPRSEPVRSRWGRRSLASDLGRFDGDVPRLRRGRRRWSDRVRAQDDGRWLAGQAANGGSTSSRMRSDGSGNARRTTARRGRSRGRSTTAAPDNGGSGDSCAPVSCFGIVRR